MEKCAQSMLRLGTNVMSRQTGIRVGATFRVAPSLLAIQLAPTSGLKLRSGLGRDVSPVFAPSPFPPSFLLLPLPSSQCQLSLAWVCGHSHWHSIKIAGGLVSLCMLHFRRKHSARVHIVTNPHSWVALVEGVMKTDVAAVNKHLSE